jgi:hypothetical protein
MAASVCSSSARAPTPHPPEGAPVSGSVMLASTGRMGSELPASMPASGGGGQRGLAGPAPLRLPAMSNATMPPT